MPVTKQETLGHLLVNVCRLHATRCDQLIMERIGLYRGQGFLLMFLSNQDGATHTTIAKKLRISPAAATKVIKRLEENGYLKRQPDPADERVSRVYLQEKGRALSDEIRRSFHELDESMLAGLSEEDLTRLREFLQKMQENLKNKPAVLK